MPESHNFEIWWVETAPSLLVLAVHFLPDREAALDLVQDVAILAVAEWRGSAGRRWESPQHFRNWARLRLRWLAIDHIRHAKQFPSVPLDNVRSRAYPPTESPGTHDVLSVVTELPERQKAVVMKMLEGKTAPQIAHELGIQESTVRSLLRFAKQRIICILEERGM